jgi:hypothetical protein
MLLPAASGCAGYLRDRLKDASEIVELSAGLSIGVEANVRATKVLQAGVGSYNGDWCGLKEGRLAAWREHRVEMGIAPFFYQELKRTSDTLLEIRHPRYGESGFEIYMNDLHLITDRGLFEFGLTANLIVLGIDLDLDGAELADFLMGWFGVDILSDDAWSRTQEELVMQVNSSDPWKRAAAVRALHRVTGKRHGYVHHTSRDEFPEEQVDAWRRWKVWLEHPDE